MSMLRIKPYLLVIIWFSLASFTIFWLASASKAEFDPHLKLSQGLMSLSFEDRLTNALTTVTGQLDTPAIFHISQGECYCEYLTSTHQSKLNKWSAENGFLYFSIDISQLPALAEFIPSTPAIVAIDEHGSLLYLGPYSRGSGCFANTGEVDTALNDYVNSNAQNKAYQRTIIELDARGCYCAT